MVKMMRDKAEEKILTYVDDYLKKNRAAKIISQALEKLGIGFRPILDHITIRTRDVFKRTLEFLALGYVQDRAIGPKGILDYGDWFAIVLRKPGLPAIFIDQAKRGFTGRSSVILPWVKTFGDRTLHHVAIQVDDIEKALRAFKGLSIRFTGGIVGERGSSLRQIFTSPEIRKGEPFSVLEITERHCGYTGFQPPQADRLMQSTKLKMK